MNSYRSFMTIFFFASISLIKGQDVLNRNENYQKNHVKDVKVYEYGFRKGKVKGRGKLLFHEIYDSSGFKTSSFSYAPGEYHQEYKYDSLGNMIAETGYVLNDPVTTTYKYKFDEHSRIIEKTANDFNGKWHYRYNEAGNMTRSTWFLYGERDPKIYFIDSFIYDGKNKIVQMIRYNNTGDVYFYKNYEYDSVGNLVKEIRLTPPLHAVEFKVKLPFHAALETLGENGDTTDCWVYHYDARRNRIASETYDRRKKKMMGWNKTVYSDKGLITEECGKVSSEEKEFYRKYVYEFYK